MNIKIKMEKPKTSNKKGAVPAKVNASNKVKPSKKQLLNPKDATNRRSNTKADHKKVDQIKFNCKVASPKLKKYTDRTSLSLSTKYAPDINSSFGQPRAVEALLTAFDIQASGYHVFAVGENGLGKRTFIQQFLKHQGHKQGALYDWIYVHNFTHPKKPSSIALELGTASRLLNTVTQVWNQLILTLNSEPLIALRVTNAAILNSNKYEDLLRETKSLNDLNNTDNPNNSNNPNNPNNLNRLGLAASEQHDLEQIHQQSVEKVITPFFDALILTYEKNNKLVNYLHHVKADMILNAYSIAQGEDTRFFVGNLRLLPDRYSINILYESEKQDQVSPSSNQALENCASNNLASPTDDSYPSTNSTEPEIPIVFEPHPTLTNLLGFVEQTTEHGSLISNHCMILPGALHSANGGYLLIEANHLIQHPAAWEALKLCLQSGVIDLSNYQQNKQHYGLSLIPDPIPLKVKVILLGDPELYEQFTELDPEFYATFKIRADFHEEVIRNPENEMAMTSKMADIIQKYQMRHFDNTAQAVILEHLSLQCEDQNKLSLHTDRLIQIMLEANRQSLLTIAKTNLPNPNDPERPNALTVQSAKTLNQPPSSETLAITDNTTLVNSTDVQQALESISYRSAYLKELYLQEITNGQQLISTKGYAVGQINALTIVDYADSEFGMPALLTAVVQHSEGSGDILDIERDVELGGSLHAKGMLIMNSYLRALFSPFHPLNFTASLAFEQSYAHIDGDSATLSEACALLSALAEIPIAQSLALTGSMNQLGRVQAVGGVNSKVAGFYDACAHQGLSGNQGVILPFANINQLMLRDDIVSAVETGKFHIYGVNTLSEALTILSDMPVDTMTNKGHYHKTSLFGKIIKNLKKWEDQLNPPEEASNIAIDESLAVSQRPLSSQKPIDNSKVKR